MYFFFFFKCFFCVQKNPVWTSNMETYLVRQREVLNSINYGNTFLRCSQMQTWPVNVFTVRWITALWVAANTVVTQWCYSLLVLWENWTVVVPMCRCKTFKQYNNANKHKAKSPEVFISESERFSVSCSDVMEGVDVMWDLGTDDLLRDEEVTKGWKVSQPVWLTSV